MIKIGVTGSIGMGKSTVAGFFAALGAEVWDADKAVHRLYGPSGAAVAPVLALFGDVGSEESGIDRAKLAAIVLNDQDALQKLEAVVHPLVDQDRQIFLRLAEINEVAAVVLDIPLLFENELQSLVDVVVVASAPADVQRERVLARPNMNSARLDAILSQQMVDEEKRKRADFVVLTDQEFSDTQKQVEEIYRQVTQPQ